MDRGIVSYWAEFLGTFTLCFVGQGTICSLTLAGHVELLPIAVAHGLALTVMISAFGATSSAHFNPAVTFGFLVTRKLSVASALRYWVSQLLGAVVASWLLTLCFPASVWQSVRLGAAAVSPEISPAIAMLIEFVLTFFLVTVVWGTEVDTRSPKIGGFAIGLTVLMDILIGGPLTGAAMNPARAFGPALISGAWGPHWVWWIGPLAGGALAAVIYRNLVLPAEER